MKGISMTWQPSSRSAEERAPACFFARETRTRHPARGRVLRAMFVRGLFAKVGVLRFRRRKPSAASTPSKIIHHPSASLRAGSDTEDTEFRFLRSFLRDLSASVVDFILLGGPRTHVTLRMTRSPF